MAAAGDADDIGEAEATRATRRRTIYDYLGEGEEDGGEAAPASPETPPRLRLPRFACARIRLGRKRGGGRAREAELPAADKGDGGASVAGSSSGSSKQGAGTTTTIGGGAMGVAAAAAQTGMGLSMLLLLARTCVELNRMAEVRAQMEALLEEIRDEASRVKGAAAVAQRTCNNLQSSSSTTTAAASSSCVSDTSTNCVEIGRGEDDGKTASEDEGFAGLDDALEAEPEPRQPQSPPPERQCNAEQETPECSMQSSDDEFIQLDGGCFGRGDGGGGGNGDPVDSDEDDDDGGGSSRERSEGGGVSAVELERRLHELRHRRDRERIKALEAALRRAERRVTEKEMEARLWQDTAALALGQPTPRHRHGQ